MKKFILILVTISLLIGCAVTKPSWTNIGSDGIYIETHRDTIHFNQLDSLLKSHNIKPTLDEMAVMYFSNSDEDFIAQYTYTKGQDTIYVITDINDSYVFTRRIKIRENK